MAEFGFSVEDIARLIKLVEQRGLAEIIVEEDDQRVVIRGAAYAASRQRGPAAAPVANLPLIGMGFEAAGLLETSETAEAAEGAALNPEAPAAEHRLSISSPMVGVFYRSPSPDAPPYVSVGDHVKAGQTVGLLEAMKVYSEIQSEHAGTVAEVVAESGQLVRPGEPLVFLNPDA